MSVSVLERLRLLYEEVEVLERAGAAAILSRPKPQAAALLVDLRIAAYARRSQQVSKELQRAIADADGSKKAEVSALSGPECMNVFYSRLGDVREATRRGIDADYAAASSGSSGGTHTGSGPIFDEEGRPIMHAPMERESSAESALIGPHRAADAVLQGFTDEEMYGRYLDLQACYSEWCALPGVKEVRTAAVTGESVSAAAAASGLGEDSAFALVDYVGWLKQLKDAHTRTPGKTKASRHYRRYAASLAAYLVSVFARNQPLVDVCQYLSSYVDEFVGVWGTGSLPGWSTAAAGGGGGGGGDASSSDRLEGAQAGVGGGSVEEALLPLTHFTSPAGILEAWGAEGCKTQLRARGIKCGGSPLERATRLWEIRDLTPAQYPKKLLAPVPGAASATAVNGDAAPAHTPPAPHVSSMADTAPALLTVDPVAFALSNVVPKTHPSLAPPPPACVTVHSPTGVALTPPSLPTGVQGGVAAAWCEFLAAKLLSEALSDSLDATRRRLERRATKTREEVDAEKEQEVEEMLYGVGGRAGAAVGAIGGSAMDEDDEDEDVPIYNKLNIPLGWDGKPIPVWLYKLHGLNIEYQCEICNASYHGRRDFDRHFQEWRHAFGMRALGIPNTKHFHDITRVEDARALWSRMQAKGAVEGWKAEVDEEFEDSLGNVLNRRTYEDLARHGLL